MDLSEEDMESIKSFAMHYDKAVFSLDNGMVGAKLHEMNLMLTNMTIMKQNMLIIKQLDRLNKNMEMMIHR